MITEGQIITIESAEYVNGYKIRLQFNDQTTQTINFENFIRSSHNPHIAKYSNLELFKNFSITDGDLEWNDYDLCFPIIDLYEYKNIGDVRHGSNEAA
jgi:hypothetical protein